MPLTHQVKIFHGTEDDTAGLERDINAWLSKSGARVVNIFGNIAPQAVLATEKSTPLPGADPGLLRRFGASDVLVVVLYEQ